MQTIAFIIAFFLLGYVAKRFISEPATLVKWFNHYILYLAMPSIILLKIPAIEFTAAMLMPAGFAWLWALIGGGLMLIVSRLLKFPRPLEGAAILLVILGNTAFLGYPMVQAYYDDAVLSYAIYYDQLGSFLVLSTIGLIVIAVYAPTASEQSINIKNIVKRIFGFPPFIALMIASVLSAGDIPSELESILALVGKTLMPLALMVIGLQFKPQLLPEHKVPIASVIALKMIVAPVLAAILLTTVESTTGVSVDTNSLGALLTFSPSAQAIIMQAAMPCMITPGILAIQAGLSPRFCATLLGYSTLFSFAWLPLIAALTT